MESDRHRTTLCLQWSTFGPYHAARLHALAALASAKHLQIVGIETAAQDATYGFTLDTDLEQSVRTVFPESTFDNLAPRDIELGIRAILDDVDPAAVGITSYSYPDARACLAWCRENGRAAILMTDSKADAGVRRRWREWVKRQLVSGYDSALVAGRPQRAYLRQLGFPDEAIFDGYNVVDNDHFSRGAESARRDRKSAMHLPGLSSRAPYFIASGRMTRTKNYSGLLEAYRRYREISPDPWRLIIIGDGPLRNELERKITGERIGGVVLAGRRSYSELPAYYGLAGALVHSATVDTWGLVVNEAMAARLPIICSTGTGCWQDLIIEGENGFVFGPNDTELLANLMNRLSSDENLRSRMADMSFSLVQAWRPERFAQGFLSALEYAMDHAAAPSSFTLRAILRLLTLTAKSPTSFQSIKP